MKKQKMLYPELYEMEDEIEPVKKARKRKKSTKKIKGCPIGYLKNELGQCIKPEIKSIDNKLKELEDTAKKLTDSWKAVENLSKGGGKYPFQNKEKRLDIIPRLIDENIDDLKNIKRFLFW